MNPERPSNNEIPEPTKEFFLSDPKSAKIRETSLVIIQKIAELLHDPELADNPTEKAVAYSTIQNLTHELTELGITPNMHVGIEGTEIKSDPVIAAEYIAGQLLKLTDTHIISEKKVSPLLDEFNELPQDQVRLIDTQNMPKKITDFVTQRSVLNILLKMFAA